MTQEWVDFIAYFTQNNPSPVMTPILKNTSIVDFSEKNISVSCENLGMKIFLETRKKKKINNNTPFFFFFFFFFLFSPIPKEFYFLNIPSFFLKKYVQILFFS